ncbi:uncharacterized protein LOC128267096 [Anopheles cruzii]|uniref:uncharacterized protein LOC128267096 n=1 Tax=Anopheles cruzii TaxID=68878 RepID=UPI0022EC9183|nr:uncharacterized protein LOC128267096 [Anopheles cruzii]
MPRVAAKKEAVSKDERLKRKNPHPVRNFFQRLNDTQQKCGFCGWVTRENATRMERHIAYSCPSAHEMVRGMMLNMKELAIERERNSSLTEHNKKDVHCYFATVENDRKRQCIFCEWRTTPNLTRMRKHIAIVCTMVPAEIRALFFKGEGEGEDDEDCDSSTYRIVDVLEDGERKDFEIVSSAQLQEYESIELGSEVQLASDPADDGSEYYQLDVVDYREHAEETTPQEEAIQAKEKTSRKPKLERNEPDDGNEDEDVLEEHTRGDGGDDGMGSDDNNLEYLEPQEQYCFGCHQTLGVGDPTLTRSGKVFCSSACSHQERGGNKRAADKSVTGPKRPVKAARSSTPQIAKRIVVMNRADRKPATTATAVGQPQPINTLNPSLAIGQLGRPRTAVIKMERAQEPGPAKKRPLVLTTTKPATRSTVSQDTAVEELTENETQETTVVHRKNHSGVSKQKLPVVTRVDKIEEMQSDKLALFLRGTCCCLVLTLFTIIIQQTEVVASGDEGSCHSFGGGHVYPQEAPQTIDHKLQYTKAVISRPAPEFEATAVVDGAFKKLKLSDYRGKYLVFFFYPLDFTFVCPTEILAFSDRVDEFRKLNTEVIAASIDSHFTHLAWINTPRKEGGLGKINIPLVSDITHSIAKDYGVFLDDLGHTLRGLFIIDNRGILRQITMNDLPVGRSVDETLRLVQAFQYTDKHGEVCPAGWKPGQDTIVPNPEAKIRYFQKNN